MCVFFSVILVCLFRISYKSVSREFSTKTTQSIRNMERKHKMVKRKTENSKRKNQKSFHPNIQDEWRVCLCVKEWVSEWECGKQNAKEWKIKSTWYSYSTRYSGSSVYMNDKFMRARLFLGLSELIYVKMFVEFSDWFIINWMLLLELFFSSFAVDRCNVFFFHSDWFWSKQINTRISSGYTLDMN